MVLMHNLRASLIFKAAAESGLTVDLGVDRPWLRLGSFIMLAALLLVGTSFVLGLSAAAIPGLRDQFDFSAPSPDDPLRLAQEGVQVVLFGAIMASLAFGVLTAAALTYRQPLRAFLWPGRRFDGRRLAIGFVFMAGVAAVLEPFYLATGGEWAPPLFDPAYADHTRLPYVLTMTFGLLVAAAAEEVMFRGVLLRLTALVTRQPVLLCLVNGLLFAAIHVDPDPATFVARTLSGMVWTWAALRLGGLEFAIGGHLAHNLYIALLLSPFSEAAESREGKWVELGPEVFVALVTIAFVEWLARRKADPAPVLPARPPA